MAEFLVIFALASPFLLMVWLTWARKRAQAKVAAAHQEKTSPEQLATDEVLAKDEDGLVASRHHPGDAETSEPDHSGGEFGGIRAMQGRRD